MDNPSQGSYGSEAVRHVSDLHTPLARKRKVEERSSKNKLPEHVSDGTEFQTKQTTSSGTEYAASTAETSPRKRRRPEQLQLTKTNHLVSQGPLTGLLTSNDSPAGRWRTGCEPSTGSALVNKYVTFTPEFSNLPSRSFISRLPSQNFSDRLGDLGRFRRANNPLSDSLVPVNSAQSNQLAAQGRKFTRQEHVGQFLQQTNQTAMPRDSRIRSLSHNTASDDMIEHVFGSYSQQYRQLNGMLTILENPELENRMHPTVTQNIQAVQPQQYIHHGPENFSNTYVERNLKASWDVNHPNTSESVINRPADVPDKNGPSHLNETRYLNRSNWNGRLSNAPGQDRQRFPVHGTALDHHVESNKYTRQYEAPQYNACQNVAPQYDPRQNMTPQYNAKLLITPKGDSRPYVAPQYDTTQYVAPHYDTMQCVAPQYNTRQSVAPQYDPRHNVALLNNASQYVIQHKNAYAPTMAGSSNALAETSYSSAFPQLIAANSASVVVPAYATSAAQPTTCGPQLDSHVECAEPGYHQISDNVEENVEETMEVPAKTMVKSVEETDEAMVDESADELAEAMVDLTCKETAKPMLAESKKAKLANVFLKFFQTCTMQDLKDILVEVGREVEGSSDDDNDIVSETTHEEYQKQYREIANMKAKRSGLFQLMQPVSKPTLSLLLSDNEKRASWLALVQAEMGPEERQPTKPVSWRSNPRPTSSDTITNTPRRRRRRAKRYSTNLNAVRELTELSSLPYTCTGAGCCMSLLGFESEKRLRAHTRAAHVLAQGQDNPVRCRYCNFVLSRADAERRHIVRVHPDEELIKFIGFRRARMHVLLRNGFLTGNNSLRNEMYLKDVHDLKKLTSNIKLLPKAYQEGADDNGLSFMLLELDPAPDAKKLKRMRTCRKTTLLNNPEDKNERTEDERVLEVDDKNEDVSTVHEEQVESTKDGNVHILSANDDGMSAEDDSASDEGEISVGFSQCARESYRFGDQLRANSAFFSANGSQMGRQLSLNCVTNIPLFNRPTVLSVGNSKKK